MNLRTESFIHESWAGRRQQVVNDIPLSIEMKSKVASSAADLADTFELGRTSSVSRRLPPVLDITNAGSP
jgi:hypothetical protein